MPKKRRIYVRKLITLDKGISDDLDKRKILTGIPISRQLEDSYKEFKKRMG
jgi:hypothetical protein